MTDDQGDELTGGEAALLLGITRQQVNALAHAGKLAGRRSGRWWTFRRADVLAYQAAPKSQGGRPKGRTYGTPSAPAPAPTPTPAPAPKPVDMREPIDTLDAAIKAWKGAYAGMEGTDVYKAVNALEDTLQAARRHDDGM